ncbi:hypothetical protein A9Q99_01090 [Gammaproteobacteria bacterium 45_16_T64]|nr:hypothetical protein A9Q99_01090 [Gammaproteobacteria bacterium 45_16_T64]
MFPAIRSAFSFRSNLRSLFYRNSSNYSAIDGLRAISILLVILFHTFKIVGAGSGIETTQQIIDDTPFFLNWIWNGDKSVDIFFIISGFLIAGLLFKEYKKTATIKLKRFYVRRFFRLTPVYLLALALYGLSGAPNAENIWANLLYVNNFLPLEEQAFQWGWTLAVEEQFYLLFPLFLLTVFLPSKKPMRWLIALFLLSFVIRLCFVYFDKRIWHTSMSDFYFDIETFRYIFSAMYDNLYTRYGAFLCGIGAAYIHHYHHDKAISFFANTRLSLAISAASLGVISIILLIPIFDPQAQFNPTFTSIYLAVHRNIFSLCLGWVILSAIYSKDIIAIAINKFLSMRLWFPVAQLSYSTYLVHYAIVQLVLYSLMANLKYYQVDISVIKISWLFGGFFIASLVSLLVAVVAYLLIEKPALNLRNSFDNRKTSQALPEKYSQAS